jgi:hypothetical protein
MSYAAIRGTLNLADEFVSPLTAKQVMQGGYESSAIPAGGYAGMKSSTLGDMPRFANPGMMGTLGTMGAGSVTGGFVGYMSGDGSMGSAIRGAAFGAVGAGVARAAYQPALNLAQKGANLAANRGASLATMASGKGQPKMASAMKKLGQGGQSMSSYLDSGVNMFHNTSTRRAAYTAGAGLAGVGAGYRSRQKGYQRRNLSQGRLNSGRGNGLAR